VKEFPAELGGLSTLEVLDLHQNGHIGRIPDALGDIERLKGMKIENSIQHYSS
jgi:hypothetical protein